MSSNLAVENEKSNIVDLEAIEKDSNDRYELINGFIRLMTKASINHGFIALNVANLLNEKFNTLKRNCKAIVETVEIEIINENREDRYRPDVTVMCKPYDGKKSIITNPKLIVEVLSKSSMSTDHYEKREGYLEIEGLLNYIVVNQFKKEISVYSKTEKGFECKIYKEGECFSIKEWFEIKVDDIYFDIEF